MGTSVAGKRCERWNIAVRGYRRDSRSAIILEMTSGIDASTLLRRARAASGLTQRELARRAATSQSVVARVESGQVDPSTGTLSRLLEAAGHSVRVEIEPLAVSATHMLDDVSRILAMTPEERLVEVRNVARFEAAVRRV